MSQIHDARRSITAALKRLLGRRTIVAAFAAAVVACGGAATEPVVALIRIEPVKAVFSPGEALFLRVSNVDTVAYGANPCRATLEVATEKGWIAVTTSSGCGDVSAPVPVGASLVMQALLGPDVNLPATVPAGVYRVVIDIVASNRTRSDRVASTPFRVAAPR